MSYKGYIAQVKNIRPAENADRLNLCDVFGNSVVVSKDINENDLYVYFPCDGQLSLEFCINNNLLRKLPDGTPGPGYLDLDKRNVKAINLRGNKSDGIVLPLSCLDYCFTDGAASHFSIGDTIDVVNGHEICTKYIPRSNHKTGKPSNGNKTRKHKAPIAPLFSEHADTEQLAYNLGAFRSGDEIEITLKMHGTSGRTAHVPVLKGYKRTIWDRVFKREGTPIYEWGYVSGTRRTILKDYDGGFYGDNHFREPHAKFFEGKLRKGEIIYYEIVGYTDAGKPIMASGKVPKEYQNQYGKIMEFSYGCEPCQSDIYVYRMTMTNEDGDIVEYTPDFMRYRCEQMGVKTVPVFWKGAIPENPASADDPTIEPGEWIKNVAERFYDGPDPIGKTHIREGVVVRIINRPAFCAYKHKNHLFKVISGIIAESVADSDIEINEDILSEL